MPTSASGNRRSLSAFFHSVAERTDLRTTFDSAAALYHRARPGYPSELYQDLLAVTALEPPARLLEIGPGTGNATLPFAERGFAVHAVELGAGLAAAASANLAPYSAVTVEVADFDTWKIPSAPFDMVYSATAFHWLNPETRLDRCAAALRSGGWLAVWNSTHVDGGDRQFWIDVQDCYERWDPDTPPGLRLTASEYLPDDSLGIEHSSHFSTPRYLRYDWTLRYTRDAYLDVLRTYSGHIALPEPNRSALFECIGGLIDRAYSGAVTKAYLTHLTLAQKR